MVSFPSSRSLGLALGGFGLAALTGGIGLITVALLRDAAGRSLELEDRARCLAALETVGQVTLAGDTIRVIGATPSNPRGTLANLSAALLVCHGWTLVHACLGSSCGSDGTIIMSAELTKTLDAGR